MYWIKKLLIITILIVNTSSLADQIANQKNIKNLWSKYNYYANELSTALGRTSNIVGEYAEYLVYEYYQGDPLSISHASADVIGKNGYLYQVKARKLKKIKTTQLGIIRSWYFDYLIVILFDKNGTIYKALKVPVAIAQKHAKRNKHQNGWVISTNKAFLNDQASIDITKDMIKKLHLL